MKMIKKIKHWYKVRKIEREIVITHIKKEIYGEIDTATWWFEIQRLEKELADAKNSKLDF